MRLRPGGVAVGDAVVVLTGASSGIGRATALELARHGAAVVLAARDDDSLRDMAAKCEQAGARDVLIVPTDVSQEASVAELAERALEHFGDVDVWINNAAVMAYGRADELSIEWFRQVIETNFFGTVYGSRAALQWFREREHGVLVNVASLYSKLTSPYVTPYVSSKYAILGFGRCLRSELADYPGIDVVTLLPQGVDTPIFRHAGNATGREVTALPPAADPWRVVKAIIRCIERPKEEITVGLTGRLMVASQIVTRRVSMPQAYDRISQFVMDRVGFHPAPAEQDPGNLFEPERETNRISGEWRAGRRGKRLAAGGLIAATALIVTSRARAASSRCPG